MSRGKLLVYLLRRDLRVADNPILHHLATTSGHGFTHLLPVYVFPAHQVEVSGFLKDGEPSPYPPAKSQVGKFWRCGPHRAKFTAEAVWNLKKNLEDLGSGLALRLGSAKDVIDHLIKELKGTVPSVNAVWMTEEPSWEEVREQESISALCSEHGIEFKLWKDEKYFVDDRDTGLESPADLPDVFTTYRKSQEPLREKPRKVLPRPDKSSLPMFPQEGSIPAQAHPFVSPASLEDIQKRLAKPLENIIADTTKRPQDAINGHPFTGGESSAWERLKHLVKSGAMTSYKDTRNGLVGVDYSLKLSGYLALGCLTARQIHEELLKLEDGTDEQYKDAAGYGDGENDGTKGIRFELLWRDYMRLCTAKFGRKLFRLSGFRQDRSYDKKWKTANEEGAAPEQEPTPARISKILERFQVGTTGMGIIDASQRELFHTGYTSNRARQNAASFFSKHLEIDWRYGAEWYEMMLVDYDVSSNWANWQYVAGIGNDPRGDARTFNPVKQAFDYDKEGIYVRMWVTELQGLEKLENVFQVCTTEAAELKSCGLSDSVMVTDPVKKIDFHVDRKPRATRRLNKRRGHPRGGRWGGNYNNQQHNGSGTSSDAAAGELAGAPGADAEARDQARTDGTSHKQSVDVSWRENNAGGQPSNAQGQNGRGWKGGDQSRGRGNGGQFRGTWRPYGQRGGFRGRGPSGFQVPYQQFPSGGQ
ncbi:Cryptochrome, DASH [Metarhizium album ARSEF 1941]|uniref:Cryptochrome DASH n=1 Tax=Metarhizium album (strain ARSEF 1941) TaxID=1081103 RepID=A0A0B2X0U4_METAS|nr:Cryptochrome, DASH [Metarhizium album ARSEF 1941]KHN98700.1 Cryptochrome, DASH [Metarhizium album ARSEF 1941]